MLGAAPGARWGMGTIPIRSHGPDDEGVEAAIASWVLVGAVVGLVAHRIVADGVPAGALGALLGGGAGGFLGGAISAVVAGADGGRLDPVSLVAAAAGAAALVATIGVAGRGSVSGR